MPKWTEQQKKPYEGIGSEALVNTIADIERHTRHKRVKPNVGMSEKEEDLFSLGLQQYIVFPNNFRTKIFG